MKFTILEKAGLSQREFADLVGVSRITVNTWVTGKHQPADHVRPRVLAAIKHLTAMVRDKQLPIDRDQYRKDRAHKLRHVRAVVDANTLAAQG